MSIHDEKTIKFKPITAIAVILGFAFAVSLIFNITGLTETKELRRKSKVLQKSKDSLLERIKTSRPLIEKDSLKVVELEKSGKIKDSIIKELEKSDRHYRDKWYSLYKKLKDAQNNYNNASRRERDSLAAILAKRKG